MNTQTKQYENLSKDVGEWMSLKNTHGAYIAAELLNGKISSNGEIQTEKPLERILVIVEKHRQKALARQVDLAGLNAYGMDGVYRVEGKCSPEYRAFTREILDAPNFTYSADEASSVGTFQRELAGADTTDIIVDRILLKNVLGNVKNAEMQEKIWDALTLYQNNGKVIKDLQEKYGRDAENIVREMETTVMPAYEKFLKSLRMYDVEHKEYGGGTDRGIKINAGIALTRMQFIDSIIEYAKFHMGHKSDAVREVKTT